MLRAVFQIATRLAPLQSVAANFNLSNKATIFSLSQSLLRRPLPPSPVSITPVREMASLKHKKVLKRAKGFRGRANRCFTVAFHRVQKAKQYAYRDRKVKKREMRSLWIMRMNAASRMYSMPYSHLVNGMIKANIGLNRKVLADLAVTEPLSFKSVVEVVKQSN